jgi:hypothetical protein
MFAQLKGQGLSIFKNIRDKSAVVVQTVQTTYGSKGLDVTNGNLWYFIRFAWMACFRKCSNNLILVNDNFDVIIIAVHRKCH